MAYRITKSGFGSYNQANAYLDKLYSDFAERCQSSVKPSPGEMIGGAINDRFDIEEY